MTRPPPHRYNRRDHHYDRRRRSPDRDKERYPRVRGLSRESDSPKMSKEQRRQLFELKVREGGKGVRKESRKGKGGERV